MVVGMDVMRALVDMVVLAMVVLAMQVVVLIQVQVLAMVLVLVMMQVLAMVVLALDPAAGFLAVGEEAMVVVVLVLLADTILMQGRCFSFSTVLEVSQVSTGSNNFRE